MRLTAILLAAAIFAAPAFADKESKGPVYEPNTYRFGGTYSVVSSRSASQCATACGRDTNCQAWSFVDLPGASAQNACELKSVLGRSEPNPTSVSGISSRLEKNYQPSPYRNASTLAGGRVHSSVSAPTRKTVTSARSAAPRRVVTSRPPAAQQAATSAPRTITRRAPAPTRVAAPKSYRSAPAAPARVTSAPAPRGAPITTRRASTTPAQPSVQFQPLKRSADGTYTPTAPKTTTSGTTSRVVLTGPKGDDVAKAVHGRVVLKGDMAGPAAGGVGETPAAPIPRNAPVNAQGERVPYKDISSREYPDYSVTRAAEQGSVEPVDVETDTSGSTLPHVGS